jgi:FKBP-type peptidyl-prolyl cis-trans isomerase SlyD
MSSETKPEVVDDDIVVLLEYTLTVDGDIFDTSVDAEPIEFLQGHQNIIPGLEKALYGMVPGEEKEVLLAPADAYGDYDPDRLVKIARSDIPDNIEVKKGNPVQLQDNQGNISEAVISEIEPDQVILDLNHPLAGKDLLFNVRVTDLRNATPEEISHGHVHGEGHDH